MARMAHTAEVRMDSVTDIAPLPASTPAVVLAPATGLSAALRLLHAACWFVLIVGSYRLQRGLVRVTGWTRLGRGFAERRWERVHAKNARRFHDAAVALGGLWLKIGQMLSVMGSFLPGVWTTTLGRLQDRVPPRSWRTIAEALDAAYGRPVESVFAELSKDAVAAASLGQVHKARLHDGREVAVKVLYPDVRARFRTDLKVVGWVIAVLRRYFPVAELERVHQQLAQMLAAESDLRVEAAALERMGDAFEAAPDVVLPRVVKELSGPSVLVMDWIDGARITDRERLAELGIAPHDAARKLLDVFFRQVFEHRFVHADPHPGNFLVQRTAQGGVKIALLDLGSAAPVRDSLVRGLVQVLGAAFSKNEDGVLAGLETMGFVSATGDRAQLAFAIKKGLGGLDLGLGGVDKSALSSFDRKEARELARAITYPEGWLPLERAIMLVAATCATEAPDLQPAQVAFPHVARFMATHSASRAR